MKYLNIYKSASKTTCSALLCIGVLSASFSAQVSAEILYPSQKPLSLTVGVPPNLLVTLDDSGSMGWGYAPDGIKSTGESSVAGRSSTYNPIYYNPKVEYKVPKKITWDGKDVKVVDYPDPVFENAKQDGFKNKPSTTDLSSKYRLFWHGAFTNDCPAGVLGCVNYGSKKDPIYGAPAHYFDYDKGCSTTTISAEASCYTYRKVEGERYGIDQQKNFSIWYEFYGNRNLATRSAANLAFYTMPDNVRLTWGALNSCPIGTNEGGDCNLNKIAAFKDQHRVNFFKWIDTFPASGGTPLHQAMHQAGEFIVGDTNDTAVCRANYHVLMTDGMWNSRGDYHKADADSTPGSLPSGEPYTPRAPFRDGHFEGYSKDNIKSTVRTLADSAFYYWATDLRSDLENKIAPYMPIKTSEPAKDYWDPRNNPATWQHMINFTVGLGLSNSLKNGTAPTWDASQESPTYANMDELLGMGPNGKKWPTVRNDSNANSLDNVYDLWHAAVNSRGEFFSADSPDSLVQAFQKILERISGRSTTGSSPAINSGVGDDGTGYAYQASYDADKNWAGNLIATKKTLGATGQVTSTQIWNAQVLLDARRASRNIKMAGSSGLVDFVWGNLSSAQKGNLNRNPDLGDKEDKLGEDRLSFLRGDTTKDGTTFRKRTSVLGDIVSSKPITVRGARYLTGHANRIEGADKKYEDFVAAQKNRTPMVYVGANDGMLHGFNANTGVETFAFVPSAVFPNLNKLTATGYGEATHRYFVDGSPVVADVFIGNAWKTVLVGTLGAGGKAMFALDVTDPADIKLLWEFGEDKLAAAKHTAKLGYTFSEPTIARLHNGKWAAVVGNGYSAAGSDDGKAALLIIDMATGELTKDLIVQGTAGVANGMSTPKLADINADGIADYAYAGDLQGNVWRFDLAPPSSDANNPFLRKTPIRTGESVQFQVSFAGNSLFAAKDSAGNAQPITAAPSIVRHPTNNGYIVVVGTGRYYADGDKDGLSNASQSIYGVWDPTTKVARSAGKAGFPYQAVTRSNLQEQVMQSSMYAVSNGKDARLLSQKPVLWAEPTSTGWTLTKDSKALKAGWYFDLVLNKEMIVADMSQFGKTLYFQTLLPNADPCAAGVENWLYAINPATGGRTLHHAWTDYRNVDSPNTVITAVRMDGEGGLSIGQRPDKKFELCTGATCNEITPDPASIGRQGWRVVEGY